MDTSLRTKIGRSLNVLGLRDVVRSIEQALTSDGFRPADTNTPLAVERALRIAMDTGMVTQGDYYEFGLYQGYTFWYAQKVVQDAGNVSMRFIGLDSFEGLPQPQELDQYKGDFARGQYRATLQRVEEKLTKQGVDWGRTILVPGFFEDTLTPELKSTHHLRSAAVAVIDCDLYSSACTVLAFLADLLLDGTLLVFDDWNAFDRDDTRGERRALREFLEDHPEWEAVPLFSYGKFGQVFRMRHHRRSTAGPSHGA
jgi:O-methyltransferase